MKKLLLFGMLACAVLFVHSCSEDVSDTGHDHTEFQDLTKGKKVRTCDAYKNLEKELKENPGLANKLANIEKHTARAIAAKKGGNGGGNGNGGGPGGGGGGTDPVPFDGTVNIPVIVHVIYSNSAENISNAQVQSQIDVLNADFNANNGDIGLVPNEFAGAIENADISFTLESITRKSSSTTSWGTNNAMKSASNGGVNVVTPETHLNIWVCNIGGGILGYAQFPGGSAATDGIVISPQYFGTTGTAQAPFDLGRTGTHEVGHYLNLRHIWGDGRCRQDDFVADTPSSDAPNYGCPNYPTVNCKSTDMTMNYMDYTDDACMQMFSTGQVDRMRAIFATGGSRESIVL